MGKEQTRSKSSRRPDLGGDRVGAWFLHHRVRLAYTSGESETNLRPRRTTRVHGPLRGTKSLSRRGARSGRGRSEGRRPPEHLPRRPGPGLGAPPPPAPRRPAPAAPPRRLGTLWVTRTTLRLASSASHGAQPYWRLEDRSGGPRRGSRHHPTRLQELTKLL